MNSEFKDRLRQAMEERGMKAVDLSKASGIGKSDISNYLNGKYLAKQDRVYILANVLGVDPVWLITGKKAYDSEEEVIETPKTPEARLLARGVDKMPKEQREQLLNVFKAIYPQYAGYFEERERNQNHDDD